MAFIFFFFSLMAVQMPQHHLLKGHLSYTVLHVHLCAKKKKPHSKYGISVCVWIHQWSILSPANRNVYSSFSMHVCSVMLDSLQPSGLKAAKLLCPWGFPGKDTGVGWHFLLQGILPELGIEPRTPAPPALAVGFLTTVPLGKALPLLCASTNTCLSKKTVWKNELHSFKKN